MLTTGVPAGFDGRRAGCQRAQADAGQPGQPGPDPAQQLAGGLAGERQSQHLAGFGVAVGDEPHHPRGHRLGFAGAGPRDDDQRSRRRGDDGGLLGGGREKALARKPIQLGCSAPVSGHSADPPSAWAGQDGRIGQCAQPSLRRAMNCGPAVASAACRTRSRHSSRAAGVSGSCSRSTTPAAPVLPR